MKVTKEIIFNYLNSQKGKDLIVTAHNLKTKFNLTYTETNKLIYCWWIEV